MGFRQRWRRAAEAYHGAKLRLEIRLGLRTWGRQPAEMPSLPVRLAKRVASGPVQPAPVSSPVVGVKGSGTLKVQAKVLRCRCGDPQSHLPNPCPRAEVEPERTLYEGPAG